MKAAVHTIYGLPGDLAVKEIAIPSPQDDELLIRVHATTVNRSDCHVLSGKPLAMRLFTGIAKPRNQITGSDFAGQVTAIGKSVTTFNVGDRVMGFNGGLGCGTHAQYFTLPEKKAAKMMITMPDHLEYEAAAACLEGAYYAAAQLNPLQPRPGQAAMVYGATGAIGSAYLQFLKYYGVTTTAVCRAADRELVMSLGAAKVIDYTTEDFTKDEQRYDFIFDAVGKSSFAKCRKLLKEKGVYTSSDGMINMLLLLVTPLFGGRKVVFSFVGNIAGQLSFIRKLVETGHFKPIIDRKYPLEKIADAFHYVHSGQKKGNVVILMD